MYLYVEMWNVTRKWINLTKEERRDVMSKMESRISDMESKGINNLGWARNDEHTPYRSDYRYITVWQMPDEDAAKHLEKNLKEANWYEYFSQANSRGEIITRKEATDFLINLKETSTSFLDA